MSGTARAVSQSLRHKGIGIFRTDEEAGCLYVGGLESDEEAWSGIRVEVGGDGYVVHVELEWNREDDQIVENIYDTIRCELEVYVDERTTISWPTLDSGKKHWLINVTRRIDGEADTVEWVKWALDWLA